MRAALEGMKFAGYDGGVVTAEFARKQLMFMKMLERKREPMEAAFTEAFGAPTKLVMRLEGDAAPQGATPRRPAASSSRATTSLAGRTSTSRIDVSPPRGYNRD